MRSLAVLTTTAAIALMGAASAQNAGVGATDQPSAAGPAPAAAGGNLESAVQAYAHFQDDMTELRGQRVRNADDLESIIDRASRHNRDTVTRGWIAYGALTASQSPEFVAGVREAAAYYGRDAVLRGMQIDTGYARLLRGGDQATKLVLQAAAADSQRVIGVADRYQELAYSLQRQRWANAVAPRQADRVQRVRGLSSAGTAGAQFAGLAGRLPTQTGAARQVAATDFGGTRFWDAVRPGETVQEVSAPVSFQWRVKPERQEAVNRMTTIAAMMALDATSQQPQQVDALMTDQRSRDCVEMAQLQLYQCMSAARFRYENAFCLAQHAMRDMGTCIGGVAMPDAPASTAALPADH